MGCDPDGLAGAVTLEAGRERFARAWGSPLPTNPGLNLMRMVDAAVHGKLKGLWVIGYDIASTNPNSDRTRHGLESLELVILQDLFLNGVAGFANVFLPAASSFEKEGTFMNSERRVQRVRKALTPPGQARPDWQIICEVGRAMGHGSQFEYRCAEQVWDEVRAIWPAGRGMSYARMNRGGLQWPCPDEQHPGTPILHRESFPSGFRAALQKVDFAESFERTTSEFPFLLTTGRTLYPFNSGTMTARTAASVLHPSALEISPRDAARLGVTSGDSVRVRSRHGEAILTARLSHSVRDGDVFATFHDAGAAINRVTSDEGDRVVATPSYKIVAVAIKPGEGRQAAAGPRPPGADLLAGGRRVGAQKPGR